MKAKKLIVEILLLLLIIAIPKITYAEGINGTTIVLNPGHGGRDTGCINREKRLYEKDLTLKISRYLEEELSKYYNVKVISTHNGVVFPKDDYGDLYARAMIARNNKADLYASLHINDFLNHEKKWR